MLVQDALCPCVVEKGCRHFDWGGHLLCLAESRLWSPKPLLLGAVGEIAGRFDQELTINFKIEGQERTLTAERLASRVGGAQELQA